MKRLVFCWCIAVATLVMTNSVCAQQLTNYFIYPVGDGTLSGYKIDQYFNNDAGHDGIDINGVNGGDSDCGVPIIASADGIVVESTYNGDPSKKEGFGNVVRIKHVTSDGERYTQYAHLSTRLVSYDQQVKIGQQVGSMGSTGKSDWCHLHFSVLTKDELGYGYYGSEEALLASHLDPISFIDSHKSSCTTTSTKYPVPLAYVSASGNNFAVSTWWQEDAGSALIPYGSVAGLASGAVKTSFSGKFTSDSLDDILTSYSVSNVRYVRVFSATGDGGFFDRGVWYQGSEDSIDKILVGDKDNNNNISNINNVLLQLCTKK